MNYCTICKQNIEEDLMKHVHRKIHKLKLNSILNKFADKVDSCKKLMKKETDKSMVVKDFAFESGRTCWCWMCNCEVLRHYTDASNRVTITDAGLAYHLIKADHKQNVHLFWRQNRLKKEKIKYYIIDEKHAKRLDETVDSFVKEHLKMRKDLYNLKARHLEYMEAKSKETFKDALLQNGFSDDIRSEPSTSSQSENSTSNRWERKPNIKEAPSSSVVPLPQNLTVISIKADKSAGNIHTGAAPPWLASDQGPSSSSRPIGPTLDDYKRQMALNARRKLPSNRVGANFDHGQKTSAQWLPSFGRVWSSGRRWQSRKEFRETKH